MLTVSEVLTHGYLVSFRFQRFQLVVAWSHCIWTWGEATHYSGSTEPSRAAHLQGSQEAEKGRDGSQ